MSILDRLKDLAKTVASKEAQGVKNVYHGVNPFDHQGFIPPAPQRPQPQQGADANVPWSKYFGVPGATPNNTKMIDPRSGSVWGLRTPKYNPYLGNANYYATPVQPMQMPNLPLYRRMQ